MRECFIMDKKNSKKITDLCTHTQIHVLTLGVSAWFNGGLMEPTHHFVTVDFICRLHGTTFQKTYEWMGTTWRPARYDIWLKRPVSGPICPDSGLKGVLKPG
jgi:hypothetical protein